MNCKIPFVKDIDMGKKVSEITSISLEHEITTKDGFLKGNFIVSGEFRSHEVSVNKEAFSYLLPFEIELNNNIDESTIEFMIDDFTYEIVESCNLRVHIDFSVIASTKEIKEEETLFRDTSELFIDDESEMEMKQNEEIKDEREKVSVLPENEEQIDTQEITDTLVKEEILDKKIETEDTIIDNVNHSEKEYATYHIHMVSDGETVETICTMYNSNINILSEYNDLNDITTGDKLIIPEQNE